MKIECLVKRHGGSNVELFGTDYHFPEQADGCHVAEVANEEHQDRFLSIPDGYRIYREGKKAAPEAKNAPKQTVLNGSSVHLASFDIGGNTIALGAVVVAAYERSGLSEEFWNNLSDDDRHGRIDSELDHIAAAAAAAPAATSAPVGIGAAPVGAEDERAGLVAEYEKVFGKKPHHKAGTEKIKAELEAAKA